MPPTRAVRGRPPALPLTDDGKLSAKALDGFIEKWKTVALRQGAKPGDALKYAVAVVAWARERNLRALPGQEYTTMNFSASATKESTPLMSLAEEKHFLNFLGLCSETESKPLTQVLASLDDGDWLRLLNALLLKHIDNGAAKCFLRCLFGSKSEPGLLQKIRESADGGVTNEILRRTLAREYRLVKAETDPAVGNDPFSQSEKEDFFSILSVGAIEVDLAKQQDPDDCLLMQAQLRQVFRDEEVIRTYIVEPCSSTAQLDEVAFRQRMLCELPEVLSLTGGDLKDALGRVAHAYRVYKVAVTPADPFETVSDQLFASAEEEDFKRAFGLREADWLREFAKLSSNELIQRLHAFLAKHVRHTASRFLDCLLGTSGLLRKVRAAATGDDDLRTLASEFRRFWSLAAPTEPYEHHVRDQPFAAVEVKGILSLFGLQGVTGTESVQEALAEMHGRRLFPLLNTLLLKHVQPGPAKSLFRSLLGEPGLLYKVLTATGDNLDDARRTLKHELQLYKAATNSTSAVDTTHGRLLTHDEKSETHDEKSETHDEKSELLAILRLRLSGDDDFGPQNKLAEPSPEELRQGLYALLAKNAQPHASRFLNGLLVQPGLLWKVRTATGDELDDAIQTLAREYRLFRWAAPPVDDEGVKQAQREVQRLLVPLNTGSDVVSHDVQVAELDQQLHVLLVKYVRHDTSEFLDLLLGKEKDKEKDKETDGLLQQVRSAPTGSIDVKNALQTVARAFRVHKSATDATRVFATARDESFTSGEFKEFVDVLGLKCLPACSSARPQAGDGAAVSSTSSEVGPSPVLTTAAVADSLSSSGLGLPGDANRVRSGPDDADVADDGAAGAPADADDEAASVGNNMAMGDADLKQYLNTLSDEEWLRQTNSIFLKHLRSEAESFFHLLLESDARPRLLLLHAASAACGSGDAVQNDALETLRLEYDLLQSRNKAMSEVVLDLPEILARWPRYFANWNRPKPPCQDVLQRWESQARQPWQSGGDERQHAIGPLELLAIKGIAPEKLRKTMQTRRPAASVRFWSPLHYALLYGHFDWAAEVIKDSPEALGNVSEPVRYNADGSLDDNGGDESLHSAYDLALIQWWCSCNDCWTKPPREDRKGSLTSEDILSAVIAAAAKVPNPNILHVAAKCGEALFAEALDELKEHPAIKTFGECFKETASTKLRSCCGLTGDMDLKVALEAFEATDKQGIPRELFSEASREKKGAFHDLWDLMPKAQVSSDKSEERSKAALDKKKWTREEIRVHFPSDRVLLKDAQQYWPYKIYAFDSATGLVSVEIAPGIVLERCVHPADLEGVKPNTKRELEWSATSLRANFAALLLQIEESPALKQDVDKLLEREALPVFDIGTSALSLVHFAALLCCGTWMVVRISIPPFTEKMLRREIQKCLFSLDAANHVELSSAVAAAVSGSGTLCEYWTAEQCTYQTPHAGGVKLEKRPCRDPPVAQGAPWLTSILLQRHLTLDSYTVERKLVCGAQVNIGWQRLPEVRSGERNKTLSVQGNWSNYTFGPLNDNGKNKTLSVQGNWSNYTFGPLNDNGKAPPNFEFVRHERDHVTASQGRMERGLAQHRVQFGVKDRTVPAEGLAALMGLTTLLMLGATGARWRYLWRVSVSASPKLRASVMLYSVLQLATGVASGALAYYALHFGDPEWAYHRATMLTLHTIATVAAAPGAIIWAQYVPLRGYLAATLVTILLAFITILPLIGAIGYFANIEEESTWPLDIFLNAPKTLLLLWIEVPAVHALWARLATREIQRCVRIQALVRRPGSPDSWCQLDDDENRRCSPISGTLLVIVTAFAFATATAVPFRYSLAGGPDGAVPETAVEEPPAVFLPLPVVGLN